MCVWPSFEQFYSWTITWMMFENLQLIFPKWQLNGLLLTSGDKNELITSIRFISIFQDEEAFYLVNGRFYTASLIIILDWHTYFDCFQVWISSGFFNYLQWESYNKKFLSWCWWWEHRTVYLLWRAWRLCEALPFCFRWQVI